MITMLEFHIKKQTDNALIEVEDLVNLFNEVGLPELAQQFGVAFSKEGTQNGKA